MNTLRLLKTSTFQLAAVYMGLFAVSALVMLAFVYWSTIGYMSSQTDSTIEAEIKGLADTYRRGGLQSLTGLVNERMRNDPDRTMLYLFATPDYKPLGGNLPAWPEAIPAGEGWVNFPFTDNGTESTARGRIFGVSGNLRLLVAMDIADLQATESLLMTAYLWGMALALVLALLGGALMSASVTRRIEVINQTSREIMSGRLHQRMPLKGTHDEFDQLASNLNDMLEQIDVLVESVRHVADGVAHDLRTPLTRLRSKLERLSIGPGLDASARQELDRCIDEADGLLQTFSALLRIARIEAGRHEASLVEVDLLELAADACELYQASAEDQGVTLSYDGSPVTLNGDRDLLFQALINLIDNALKYAGTGEVKLKVGKDKRSIFLSVTDQGPGLSEEDRQRVTGRFFRGADSAKISGSGLGLSLVQAVAGMHGARLELENANPGLRITMRFPADEAVG
ncbi:MAG: HAMP domain-containing histidine kinase [Chromatiales bacterium]|nr:HAMP domain-containing histidine kinase [Chromatiales bacterium]